MHSPSHNASATCLDRPGGLTRGFTLIELMVVISIIAVLISILLPAIKSARQTAEQVLCLSQLRQFVVAVHVYANDHKNYWVSGRYYSDDSKTRDGSTWYTRLTPYMSPGTPAQDIFSIPNAQKPIYNAIWVEMVCPAIAITANSPYVLQGVPVTYGMHAGTAHQGGTRRYELGYGLINYYGPSTPQLYGALRRLGEVTAPSACLAFADTFNQDYIYAHMTKYEGQVGAAGIVNEYAADHPGGYATVFVDGHGGMTPESRIRDDQDPMWIAVRK